MPSAGVNLVYGPNGAGKSSLLEAIYLAATTRSFRTSRLVDCCRLAGREFFVGADVDGDERVRLEVSWSSAGKRRSMNGQVGSIIDHLAVAPVVSWTARDNEIFQGPPAIRRRLMDRGIISEQAASLSVISEYRYALEAKKAALDRQTGVLAEWNLILARAGCELARRRSRWVKRLNQRLNEILDSSDLDLGRVELGYRPSPPEALSGVEELFTALERLTTAELARRKALVGPHRDDLEIVWRNGPVGRMASAGERKLFGLALTMAQSELVGDRHTKPLCLIDDLDAELDHNRLDQVWRLLGGGSQLIATTSRKSAVSKLSAAAKWQLRDGIIVRLLKDAKQIL